MYIIRKNLNIKSHPKQEDNIRKMELKKKKSIQISNGFIQLTLSRLVLKKPVFVHHLKTFLTFYYLCISDFIFIIMILHKEFHG